MMLILTEAGTGIGFGHLTRMMALGEALMEHGAPVRVLVQWEGPPLEQVVEGRGWVLTEAWRDEPVAVLGHRQASSVIVDSYRLSLDGYQAIANAGIRLTAIDDFYRLPYPADLVVNPNVFADTTRYPAAARRSAGGACYVILRPAFANAAGSFVVRPALQRILLTLGGSDVHELGLALVPSLAALGCEVHWIAPGQAKPAPLPDSITVHGTQGMDGIVRLVQQSDLVVCGGGQTLHELACLGAPCVAVELGEDQIPNLDFYEQAGCLGVRLHWAQTDLIEALGARVDALRPASVRSHLASLGRTLIDGGGAKRLASVIVDQAGGKA